MVTENEPGDAPYLPRLGFGTASLHHLGSSAERAALLDAAAAAGLTHFDTAPLYGFGLAESELGRVFGAGRGMTIATKVGLYPPGGSGQSRAQMLLRKVAGKVVPALSRAQADLNVQRAERSLTDSLRRLRRESVDVLLVHEPDPASLGIEEWSDWLIREKARGRCRWTGFAGEYERLAPLLDVVPDLVDVVQTRDCSCPVSAIHARLPHAAVVTYGCLGASPEAGRPTAELVRGALDRNSAGTVLVATRRQDRLQAFGAALEGSEARPA